VLLTSAVAQSAACAVEDDLRELEETISVVESNRGRFRLGEAEIADRRRFVGGSKARLAEIRANVKSLPKAHANLPVKVTGTASAVSATYNAAKPSEHDAYMENQATQQEMMMQEQDLELGELGQTVKRIGSMGLAMHRELQQQSHLLDELDGEMDSTTHRLRSLQHRLRTLIEETGKGHFCLIVGLTLALVVMTMLLILT